MGTTATNHPMTQVREDCFVCMERFSDVANPGTAIREEHHVIPQAAGGTDGPTVSVCLHHHDLLHKIATRMYRKLDWQDLIVREPVGILQRLAFLAQKAADAQTLTANDPNKRVKVLLSLGAKHKAMLDRLKGTIPGKSQSREAIIIYALERLYQQQFPIRR